MAERDMTQIETPPISHPRIVRYNELCPCFDAFIDTRTPGSDKKENFTIIGPGVSENPNQHVHIAEPHGFNIGGARQPAGCVNSQHSHDTAEVFYVHSGTWSFDLGEHGEDANITLRVGDIISIPTQLFRGFKNIGDDIGFLWAILGEDNPGRVLWAPKVFDMAKQHGLVLLENGNLIDTAKGEKIEAGVAPMPITKREDVEKLKTLSNADLRKCCVLSDEPVPSYTRTGTIVRKLIGPDAKLNWPHGFDVQHLNYLPGSANFAQIRSAADVIFVQSGALIVKVDDEVWALETGDTATIPRGASRQFINKSDKPVEFLRVQGEA